MLASYSFVCEQRKTVTLDYMTARTNKEVKLNLETSKLVKCGRGLKSLIVILIIGCLVGPMIYELYKQNFETPAEPIVKAPKAPKASKDIASNRRDAAIEKERKEMARQKKLQMEMGINDEEFDEL